MNTYHTLCRKTPIWFPINSHLITSNVFIDLLLFLRSRTWIILLQLKVRNMISHSDVGAFGEARLLHAACRDPPRRQRRLPHARGHFVRAHRRFLVHQGFISNGWIVGLAQRFYDIRGVVLKVGVRRLRADLLGGHVRLFVVSYVETLLDDTKVLITILVLIAVSLLSDCFM